ncbi:MAG: MBL fold metallo-hydrolase [Bdellovibrionia bacterium]
MIIKVLGSAAGGGFPQWNCACSQCYRFRKGEFQGRSRTQSQLAISSGDGTWHLLNASPDLRTQIEKCNDLQPRMQIPIRQSPIQSVILTNADLDHVLGLLLLREKQFFRIYASESVQKILLEDNSFFGMLRQTSSQTQWHVLKADREFELQSIDGKTTGLWVRPILVSSRFPGFVSQARIRELQNSEAVLGLVIRESSGNTI